MPLALGYRVIPGFNDSRETAVQYGKLLTEIGAKEVHLLPFHQLGQGKWRSLGRVYEYENVKALHEEDVSEIAELLSGFGLQVQING